MEPEMIAMIVAAPLAVVALATAMVKSRRPGNGKLSAGQQAILDELKSMNGSLGRIEGHQESFSKAQSKTAEGLAYITGRMDGAAAD